MSTAKRCLLAIVSYGLGVASGYYVCKKLLENTYRKEIAEVRESLMSEHNQKVMEEISEDFIDEEKDAAERIIENNLYRPQKGRPYFNYANPPMEEIARKLAEEKDDEDEEEEEEEEEEGVEDPEDPEDEESEEELIARAEKIARISQENKKNNRPYVIDYDDFSDAPDDYEIETLYFYSDDGYLCDENDEIIENDEEIVGVDYEDVLNTQTTAFVRNDILKKVYEIYRLDRSYKKDILDAREDESPEERELRRLARRKEALDAE